MILNRMMSRYFTNWTAVRFLFVFWIMSITSADENVSAIVETYSGNSQFTSTSFPTKPTSQEDNNTSQIEDTCTYSYNHFRKYWNNPARKLQLYLTRLKQHNCTEYFEECKLKRFAVTTYTRITYKRLCDFPSFVNECAPTLRKLGVSINGTESSAYGERIGEKIFKSFRDKDNGLIVLSEPCIQALIEEARYTGLAFAYREIKYQNIPFCGIVWGSLPSTAYKNFDVSSSFFMEARCRTNLLVFLAFVVILSIAVVIGNVIVIVVLHKLKRNANSQWVFKMSLAVADLIAGVFALPGLVVIVAHHFFGYFRLAKKRRVEYPALPREIIQVVGFFTILPLTVSVYSLLLASFDRFMVVFRPLQYEKFKALRVSKFSVLGLWTLSILFASLPFMINSFQYDTHGILVSSIGPIAYAVYGVMLVVPVVVMWVLNVGTFRFYHSNAKQTATGTKCGNQQPCNKSDKRLLQTLSVMVGAFSMCLLSLIVAMLIGTRTFTKTDTSDFTSPSTYSTLEAVGLYVMLSNSMWNFLIYNVRSLEFRSTLSKMCSDIRKKIGENLRSSSGRKSSAVAVRTSAYWLASNRSSSV